MADARDNLKTRERFPSGTINSKLKRSRFLSASYTIKKRQPYGENRKRDKDIFVTNKTNFKAQLKKCDKLLNGGASEVIIHALGAAVYRACSLALQLRGNHYGGVELDVKTSTTSIVDDFEPIDDNADYETLTRNNSSVHIRVFRTFSLTDLKYKE